MKKILIFVSILAAIVLPGFARRAFARQGDSISFGLRRSEGAAETCIASKASGKVTISEQVLFQNMHIEVSNLPKNKDFTVFLIQVPNAPFGLAWYQGDIRTNNKGKGVADLTGIFSIETFIVAVGSAPAPKDFPDNATSNPATPPIEIHHMGIWFADPADAAAAGCPSTVTPFDGDHEAGIQVLNTGGFPDGHGPLSKLN